LEVELCHDIVISERRWCLAEAAEATERETEGCAADTMFVNDDTTTGATAAEVFCPHKTHGSCRYGELSFERRCLMMVFVGVGGLLSCESDCGIE
jgi:hypothetical protein